MSLRGQRFELDLDAAEFTANPLKSPGADPVSAVSLIGEIKERNPSAPPAAPRPRDSTNGFPAHKKRSHVSAFKQQRYSPNDKASAPTRAQDPSVRPQIPLRHPPSDKAIAHHIGKKYGYDFDAKEKQEIGEENKQRIAQMSAEDIEEARAELMSSLNPAFIEKLLKRTNIDEEIEDQEAPDVQHTRSDDSQDSQDLNPEAPDPTGAPTSPSRSEHHNVAPIHFPQPPIDPSTFQPLDPSSPSFLHDLKAHYFPSTPHDPSSSMTWLTDPTEQENHESPYSPHRDNYQLSQLRFSFTGALIPPTESLNIPTDRGLHHHGLAPSSAGYTVPELAILSRSALPAQRCIAYQILGRTMYRLGRRQFGDKGAELHEGLWDVIERERVLEAMMAEANRGASGGGGHVSARAYAVEALWLWRKGCGGERGLLKEGEKRAK